jgi:hypothetical protein
MARSRSCPSVHRQPQFISILNPALDDVKAAKLTSEQVKHYIQQRLQKVNTSTLNRELGILHRAFNSATNKIHRSSGEFAIFQG